MKKILLLLILVFGVMLVINGIWLNSAFAEQSELSPLESQQYKILKLSKITRENPPNKLVSNSINKYILGLTDYNQKQYMEAISDLLEVDYSTLILPLYIKSRYLLGECYNNIKQFDQAIEIYQELVPRDPLFQDYTRFFLAETYRLNENYELSNNILNKIIQDFPESTMITEVYYIIAKNYQDLKQTDLMVDFLKKALNATDDQQKKAEILIELSENSWQNSQFLESVNYLYQILAKDYHMKRNAEPEERLIRKIESFKNLTEKISIPYNINVKVADIFFKYRQYRQAKNIYEEIIERFPTESDIEEVYYKRARTAYYLKEYQNTMDDCNKIITKFTSGDTAIRAEYLYSNTLLALGRIQDALKSYENIIEQHSQSYYARQSYLRIAEAYFRIEKNEEALGAWQKLNEKYPNSYEAMISLWKLARYHYIQEDYDVALESFGKLIERFSKSSKGDDSIYWKGKILQILGKESEAENMYQKLISDYPLSYYSERVLEEKKGLKIPWKILGNNDEQFLNLEEFLNNYDIIDDKSRLSILKAELFKEIGFFKESIHETKIALNNNPGNISILFRLNEAYKKNKDYNLSMSYTEIIRNYIAEKQLWNEVPLEFWKNLYPDYYDEIVRDYAGEYDIDPLLVFSMIREESRFNSWDESVAGARGLMQIIYTTGEWIAQKINLTDFSDEMLFSPSVNINLGCWYIHYLQERFENNLILVISGYNAGPGITAKWIERYEMTDPDNFIENIPYDETREHVKKVLKTYQMYRRLIEFENNV